MKSIAFNESPEHEFTESPVKARNALPLCIGKTSILNLDGISYSNIDLLYLDWSWTCYLVCDGPNSGKCYIMLKAITVGGPPSVGYQYFYLATHDLLWGLGPGMKWKVDIDFTSFQTLSDVVGADHKKVGWNFMREKLACNHIWEVYGDISPSVDLYTWSNPADPQQQRVDLDGSLNPSFAVDRPLHIPSKEFDLSSLVDFSGSFVLPRPPYCFPFYSSLWLQKIYPADIDGVDPGSLPTGELVSADSAIAFWAWPDAGNEGNTPVILGGAGCENLATAATPFHGLKIWEAKVSVTGFRTPRALFTAQVTGAGVRSVALNDISIGEGLTRVWDFGDGSATSSANPVVHAYASTGYKDITLQVTNAHGTSTRTASVWIPLVAGFQFFSIPAAGQPHRMSFSDSGSVNAASFSWDFGDGSPTGTGSFIIHSFVSSGTYTVTLTVGDGAGNNASTSKQVTVP